MKRNILRLVLVCTILVSSIGAPMMAQPALAQEDTTDSDSTLENAGEVACSAGGVVMLFNPKCNIDYGEVDGSTAEQVHYDIYGDSVFMQSSREQTVKEKTSYVEQTQGIAMAEAKMAIIKCMNNGNSQAVCSDKGRQAVTDTFTTVQKSLFVSQNRQMQHWQMMDQQISQTENLSPTNVYPVATTEDDFSTTFSLRTVQLYDGTEMEVLAGVAHDTNSYNDDFFVVPYYYNGNHQPSEYYTVPSPSNRSDVLNVQEPSYDDTGGTDTSIALSKTNYKNALTTLDEKHDASLTAVNEMADSIYSNYSEGDISVGEASGPLETIFTSSTSDDPLTYRVQSAQQAGYSINGDGKTVKIRTDFNDDGTIGEDEVKKGVIYTDGGAIPDNTIISGKTYVFEDDGDPATPKVTGSVMFTSNPDDKAPEEYSIDSKFAVVEAYNSAGGTTDSVGLQGNDFTTTNTDNLNSQISEVLNQMEAVEDGYESDTSSSLGGIGGVADGIMQWFQEFSLILGGILVVLTGLWFLKS